MTELRPCPACHRHVVASEVACPFCAAVLAPAAARSLARGRLSRAAVFATGALAATACGGGKDKEPPPAAPSAHDAAAMVAPVATPDAAAIAVVVDASPPVDAAPPVDAKPPADAAVAKKKPIIVHPIPDHPIPKPYGAPPARRRIV